MTFILIILAAFAEGFSVLLILPLLEGLGQETSTVSEGNRLLEIIFDIFQDVPEDQLLQAVALVFVLTTVLRVIIHMAAVTVKSWLQSRLDRELREQVYNQILGLHYAAINRRRDSDWQMILNSETGQAAAAVFMLVGIASSIFNILVYIGALVTVSWRMTLLAVLLLSVVLFLLTSLVRLADRIGKLRYNNALEVQYGTLETLNAKRIIRIMQQQDYERRRYFEDLRGLQHAIFYQGIINEASRQFLEVMVIGLLALMLWIASGVLNVEQAAIIPIVSAFILILYRMLPHVLLLNAQRTLIGSRMAAVRSVVEILEQGEDHHVEDGDQSFTGLHTAIQYEHVSFHYDKRDAHALDNVHVTIEKGATVALVGSSGAGKSTLVDLLVRLYDPTGGRILIDGVDLRDLRLADWRGHIGVVSQDTFVFNNSIGYNIAYGSPGASQEIVETAARNANAHDFISSLPEGYDTVVGDRGVFLSGGQRQRIAIARAILRDPSILLLDEATSALDTENERLIQAALERLSHNRTSLVIAHRLSTIINADKIIVLEDGQVLQQGSHAELLAQSEGRYARLYHSQFEKVTP